MVKTTLPPPAHFPILNPKQSRSGYLRRDVYSELWTTLTDIGSDAERARDIAIQRVQRACCLAAELACSSGELDNLRTALLDAFAARRSESVDSDTLVRIAECAHALVTNSWDTAAFRQAMCEIVVRTILVVVTVTTGPSTKTTTIEDEPPIKAAQRREKIRTVVYGGTTDIPDPILRGFARLHYAARRRCVAACSAELDVLLSLDPHKNSSLPHTGNGQLLGPLDASIFTSMCGVDVRVFKRLNVRQRADVTWYLWALVMKMRSSSNAEKQASVTAAFLLYVSAFSATVRGRTARQGLLRRAFRDVTEDDQTQRALSSSSWPPTAEAILQQALRKIHDVFDDVMGPLSDDAPTPPLPRSFSSSPPSPPRHLPPTPPPPRSSTAPAQDVDAFAAKPSLRWLMTYTPYDNALRTQIAAEKERERELQWATAAAHTDATARDVRTIDLSAATSSTASSSGLKTTATRRASIKI